MLVMSILLSCQNQKAKIPDEEEGKILSVENNYSLPSINIRKGSVIDSPVDIRINSEGKWFAFEGELGTAELISADGLTLGMCVLKTKEEWMVKGPVTFNCQLEYISSSSGIGELLIKNNNASGMPEHDKSFSVPISYNKTD